MSKKIAVIGAGLSGLACATELKRNNIQATVFESSDSVGGRIKTDEIDGFLLDHGFQVFLPSYEMGSYFLNYKQLNLKKFSPGSFIFKDKHFHTMSDPFREPSRALTTALSPLANLKDKLLTVKFMFSAKVEYEAIEPGPTAIEFLQNFGFSQKYINNFFIPFFSGVFLTKKLNVSADYFRFLFHCFTKAHACLPARGMAAIPLQMATTIGHENILCKRKVSAQELLEQGYDHVFVSHPPQQGTSKEDTVEFYGVKTQYYKTRSNKWSSKTLYLNSNANSTVNHVACLSAVNPNYAPEGWQLYSVNILDDAEGDSKKDLIEMFGESEVRSWELIKTYNIKKALPKNTSFGNTTQSSDARISYCGDFTESPSIQGALYSGRKVARKYLKNNNEL